VAMSWVGWSHSKAPGNLERVNKIFGWPFVVLSMDVALVILYFIIVRGAEVPAGDPATDPKYKIPSPSAEYAAFWVFIVFVGYLCWNVVTQIVMGKKLNPHNPQWYQTWWSTAIFCGASLSIWYFFKGTVGQHKVAEVKVGLLFLMADFRAVKENHFGWIIACTCIILIFLTLSHCT